MGCCFSKKKAPSGEDGSRLPAVSPPPEEETVKEVLSETTNPKPPRKEPEAEEKKKKKKVDGIEKGAVGFGPINGYDERSEDTSEVCSVSETLSVSTTVTEKREGMEVEGEVETRRKERSPAKFQRKRSFSGELAGRRDRAVAVSSVGCRSGRSSPSPARRMVEGKAYPAREPRQQARSGAMMVNGGTGTRRDPGERSGRRSVSPAAKRLADLRQGGGAGSGVCRVPGPAKATIRTPPYRVPAAEPQVNSGGVSGTGGSSTCGDEVGGGGGSVEGNESLENPLVSLECFIFL